MMCQILKNKNGIFSFFKVICRVNRTRVFSIFFKREFAASAFYDCKASEEASLDNPFITDTGTPEFFQTLHAIDGALQSRLVTLMSLLEENCYDADEISEHLLYLLHQLIQVHNMEAHQAMRVSAIKQSTKTAVYKRFFILLS